MALDFARWRAELKSEMDEAESRRAFAATFGDLQRVAEQAAATRDEYRDRIAVLDAFPKMLSALEAERKNGNPRWNAIGAEYTPTCGQCGAPDEPTGQDHSDDCLIGIALRAAREAVKP